MWYYLFYAGLISVIGALALELVRVVGSMVRYRAAATTAGSVTIAVEGQDPLWAARLASFMSWCGTIALTLMLIARVAATQRPPFTNMWEYLVAFGWGTLVCFVIFRRRVQHAAFGVAGLALVTALLVIPEIAFSSRIAPLVPALQNNRLLAIHVALMLLSYSVLGVAFVAALLFLLQSPRRQIAGMPSHEALDELAYRAVIVGFPLLAAGIALGAYWGNIAWGRYWGWDPKETTALVTLLVYAGYLHARGLSRWQGRRAAWLLMAGFAVIIFNIFAVNFWIAGLHSYAGSQ